MNKKASVFKPTRLEEGQIYRVQDGEKFAAAHDKYRTGSLFEVGYVSRDGMGWDIDPSLGLLSSKITMLDIRKEYVKLLRDEYSGVELIEKENENV